jgi:hypothetical protein
MKEIWKDIKGYEGHYQVSNFGRVKSLERTINRVDGKKKVLNEIIKKDFLEKSGYKSIRLSIDKKGRTYRIHQLVVKSFISEVPIGYVIDHIDRDKSNNFLSNLRIVTQRQNLEFYQIDTEYRGIYQDKGSNKYRCCVYIGRKRFYLGTAENINEAKKRILDFKKKNKIIA